MAESRKIVVVLAASLSTAIAGCMAATDEGDGDEREGLSAVAAPADAEESVGEAPAAHHCDHCPPGTTYVAVVNTCVTEPARFDYTPWAHGCLNGAILTGRGNVICLPTSCGNSSPPIVAIGGGLSGPQPGAFPPPAGGGLPGAQLGAFPPPAPGLGAPGAPPLDPFP